MMLFAALVDLIETRVHLLEAALDAHNRDVGVAPGRDFLVKAQGPRIVIAGPLDLVLLLGQAADVPRVPEQSVAPVAVAIAELGLLAISQGIPALFGFLESVVSLIDILQAVHVDAGEPQLRIRRSWEKLLGFGELGDGFVQLGCAAMGGAVDARDMPLGETQFAADRVVWFDSERTNQLVSRACPTLLVYGVAVAIVADHAVRRGHKLLLNRLAGPPQ